MRCLTPPMWDGMPVTWDGFQSPIRGFDMGLEACPDCGSTREPRFNVGFVQTPQGPRRLSLWRCTDCGTTTVRDPMGRIWVLDDSDFGPEGSRA